MNLEEALHELLGVPHSGRRPLDHYRLLGLERFEPNAGVIANAAEKQRLFLEQMTRGPYSDIAPRLIDMIDQAKQCLLSPGSRRSYDAELRDYLAEREGVFNAADTSFGQASEESTRCDGLAQVRGPSPGRRKMGGMSVANQGGVDASDAAPAGQRHGKKEWVVGAGPECDLVINSPYVSRRHCKVFRVDGKYWIEDLGSRNGTHVNEQAVSDRTELASGDKVTLGATTRLPWPVEDPSTATPLDARQERDAASEAARPHKLTIGRAESNDVVLEHPSVSRRHALLTIYDGYATIEDLGSTNGTYVGGSAVRISRRRVGPGDTVRIGRFTLAVDCLLKKNLSA